MLLSTRTVLTRPASRQLVKAQLRLNTTHNHHSRPLCIADRAEKKIHVSSKHTIVPPESFWEEIADERSVAQAPLYTNNIENYVGTVKVPVGMVGPVSVSANNGPTKDYYLPLATTEGALVASYNRGAKVIHDAGGAQAIVLGRQMVRAPVFVFDNVVEASKFRTWWIENDMTTKLSKIIEEQPHCHSVNLFTIQTDRNVHVHIGIDSEDAAGQNMVTYCGRAVIEEVTKTYPEGLILESFIEGGFNSGKRGSNLHLQGKGIYSVVDVSIPEQLLRKHFRCGVSDLVRYQKLHLRTSAFLNTLSYTAHVANGLCAFFIANGQDAACTAESQAAVTHFEMRHNSKTDEPILYASMTLPSLILSTVGGGTNLPAQKACLDLVGCEHPRDLACVVAALCLGGEISFFSAIVAQEFDKAHWNATHKEDPVK